MGAFYDERSVLRLRQEYEHVYNFLILNRPRHFGHANEVFPDSNFYIEPRQVQDFGENLLKRRFILYDGHRQSSKSTFCYALLRWFAEHPNKFLEITGSPVEDFEAILERGGFPSDYAFQAEFGIILNSLLPRAYSGLGYRAFLEAKNRGQDNGRLDILVHNGRNRPKYGLN
ncbi:hypothetical protein BDF19DRAFT_421176 [Syncephalis fuscata]|nr:hypothetical protein BDF19DRAFT_421176 [Syncephalis fuscata]